LKHFAVHNADVLRDFVAARHPTIKTPTGTKHLKKPRTSLADAEAGVENLVKVAFSVQGNKSRLLEVTTTKTKASDTQDTIVHPFASPVLIYVPLDPIIRDIKPSDILNDLSKLCAISNCCNAQELFLKNEAFHVRPVTHPVGDLMTKADLLFVMLQWRLRTHVRRRVKICQQSNWCLVL